MVAIMLHERIRQLRMAQGMSQTSLAEELGVTKQSVSNWENDNILPSIEMLVNIAHVFHVSTDYLLGLDGRRNIDARGLSPSQAAHVQSLVNSIRPAGHGMDKSAERSEKMFTPVAMKPQNLVPPDSPKRDSLRERIIAAIDKALREE